MLERGRNECTKEVEGQSVVVILQSLTCDWCEEKGDFQTPEEAIEDGWLRLETANWEKDFCSFDCLISSL